jgi:hypothetical protein
VPNASKSARLPRSIIAETDVFAIARRSLLAALFVAAASPALAQTDAILILDARSTVSCRSGGRPIGSG